MMVVGSRIVMADSPQARIMGCNRDSLKIVVKTPAGWPAHSFSFLPQIPSIQVAVLWFIALGVHLNSCSCTVSVGCWLLGWSFLWGLCLRASKQTLSQCQDFYPTACWWWVTFSSWVDFMLLLTMQTWPQCPRCAWTYLPVATLKVWTGFYLCFSAGL